MRNKVYGVQGKRQRNVPVSTQLNTGIQQNICIWFSSVKLRQNWKNQTSLIHSLGNI